MSYKVILAPQLSLLVSQKPKLKLFGRQFALKYEGVNLEVLALLFAKTGKLDIEAWLAGKPESRAARRVGYLYEWLTGKQIKAAVPPKTGYLPVLDEQLQFASATVKRNAKFRVLDNLPGNRNFCALVRKTPLLRDMVQKDLRRHAQEKLSRYDPDLLRRAAAYLYLKETHSSFEVEREIPSSSRAQRFADLLDCLSRVDCASKRPRASGRR